MSIYVTKNGKHLIYYEIIKNILNVLQIYCIKLAFDYRWKRIEFENIFGKMQQRRWRTKTQQQVTNAICVPCKFS